MKELCSLQLDDREKWWFLNRVAGKFCQAINVTLASETNGYRRLLIHRSPF